jgi:hypothetical protein
MGLLGLLLRAGVNYLQLGNDFSEKRQPLTNHRLHNREIRVVVVMDEYVAHARNLPPFDFGSLVEQGYVDVLDRFANLHEAGTAGIIDNTLV